MKADLQVLPTGTCLMRVYTTDEGSREKRSRYVARCNVTPDGEILGLVIESDTDGKMKMTPSIWRAMERCLIQAGHEEVWFERADGRLRKRRRTLNRERS